MSTGYREEKKEERFWFPKSDLQDSHIDNRVCFTFICLSWGSESPLLSTESAPSQTLMLHNTEFCRRPSSLPCRGSRSHHYQVGYEVGEDEDES